MKVSYKPTFDQFADNYLSTFYSGGARVLQRAAGGPALIILGGLSMVWVNAHVSFAWLRYPLLLIGLALAVYGVSYTLRPLINLVFVWLRRAELFESKQAITSLELKGNFLHVHQGQQNVKLPLEQIQSVQHRSENSWIITHSDNMIYLPRTGLLSGDHDKFMQALEKKIAPEEESAS